MKFFKGPVSCLCHGWLVHLFIMPIGRPYTCKWQKHSFPQTNLSPKHYIKRYKQRKWTLKHCVLGLQVSSSTLSIRASYISSRFFKNQPNEICGRREKNNGCPLNFYNSYFSPEKNCWTQKVHFGNNVFKNPARTSFKMSSHFEMAQFERSAELFGNI